MPTGVPIFRLAAAGLVLSRPYSETVNVEFELEQPGAVCNIEQSAFSRPRRVDLSLLKKQWRARDPTNLVSTTLPSKAESNSQEHS
jgi:hypothetical protein